MFGLLIFRKKHLFNEQIKVWLNYAYKCAGICVKAFLAIREDVLIKMRRRFGFLPSHICIFILLLFRGCSLLLLV